MPDPRTESHSDRAGGGTAAHRFAELIQAHVGLSLFLPFVVLSLIVVVVLYHDYQLGRTAVAIRDLTAAERWEAAVPHLERMLKLEPRKESEWRRKLAEAFLNAGQFGKADEQLAAIMRLNPSLNLDEPLMISHYGLGQAEQGGTYRDRILKANRNSPGANFFLAEELIAKGQFAEAGRRLRICAMDPQWNKRAEPLRRELAVKVFGASAPPAEEEAKPAGADQTTSPTR